MTGYYVGVGSIILILVCLIGGFTSMNEHQHQIRQQKMNVVERADSELCIRACYIDAIEQILQVTVDPQTSFEAVPIAHESWC